MKGFFLPARKVSLLQVTLFFLCFWTATDEARSLDLHTYTPDKTVTGVVSDETGQTLPGVNITIKGTTKGTATDAGGRND